MQAWLHKNAFGLTSISPPWQIANRQGVFPSEWDTILYQRLAQVYHLHYHPEVKVVEAQGLDTLAPDLLAAQAEQVGAKGLLLDLSLLQTITARQVRNLLQRLNESLTERGLSLLVNLPPRMHQPMVLTGLRGVLPGASLAVTTGTKEPADSPMPVVKSQTIPRPVEGLSEQKIESIKPLPDQGYESLGETIRKLRISGQTAYDTGQYREAIRLWSEWRELEPGNAKALMLVGDAYLRLNDIDQALALYERSLETDPGQIALAMRTIELMERQGRMEEARVQLNLYAELFPENHIIRLAQARWLQRQGRHHEASDVARRVLSADADNLEAIHMVLSATATKEERLKYLDALAVLARDPVGINAFADAVWKMDLLALPEAVHLPAAVQTAHDNAQDPADRELLACLVHRPTAASSKMPPAPQDLDLGGGEIIMDKGPLLQVSPRNTEATIRLKGSDRYLDSFVEAEIARPGSGHVWLYARRSMRHYIRFGVDANRTMRLQVWKSGVLLQNQEATLPAGDRMLTFRLDVRGNGAWASVDGSPVFEMPVSVNASDGLGWCGLSVHDFEPGQGAVRIRRVAAGPRPMRLVMLTPDKESPLEAIKSLRDLGAFSDLSPTWYQVGERGGIVPIDLESHRAIRLFAGFRRPRLLPTVVCTAGRSPSISDLKQIAEDDRLDGFILAFDAMPAESWFESAEEEMGADGLVVLALVAHPGGGDNMLVRPVGVHSGIGAAGQPTFDLQVQLGTEADGAASPPRFTQDDQAQVIGL